MLNVLKAVTDRPKHNWRLSPRAEQPGWRLAVQGLGWFSVGLGVAELLAPSAVAKWTGMENKRLLQACGLREIAAGAGLLSGQRPAPWLWARVAGDAMDLAGLAAGAHAQRRGRALAAMAIVGAVTAIDVVCAARLSRDTESL